MARSLSRAVCIALLCSATPLAAADCVIDANGEITNPFEPGCGDVVFTYTENDNLGTNIALGYPPPAPVASMTAVAGFRDYASLFAQHQALLTLNDEVDGEVVGTTLAGREIWAYVIGDPDSTTAEGFPEAAALINGGIHAREWQTPEAVTSLFETLVTAKADGGFFQYLVDNLNTIVVPVNNVDGFIQTQLFPETVTADRRQPREGRMRRKNLRNPVTNGFIDSDIATVADNFWGVDLNRNSLQGYGQANRSSTSPTSLVYRGAAAESEPEVLALQQAATLGPESRLRLFSDTHSFGQDYFAPQPPNARLNAITRALATRMIAASGRAYVYGPDPAGTPGIGTTADHFAFELQIPSWTLEVEPASGGQDYGGLATHGHSGFILPAAEAARMRNDVVRQYLLGFYPPERPARRDRRRDPGDRRQHGRLPGDLGPKQLCDTSAYGRDERSAPAGRQLSAVGRVQQANADPEFKRCPRFLCRAEPGCSGRHRHARDSLADGPGYFARRHGHLAQHARRRAERVSALFGRCLCSRLHRAGRRRRNGGDARRTLPGPGRPFPDGARRRPRKRRGLGERRMARL